MKARPKVYCFAVLMIQMVARVLSAGPYVLCEVNSSIEVWPSGTEVQAINPTNGAYYDRLALPGKNSIEAGCSAIVLTITNASAFAECRIGPCYERKGSKGPQKALGRASVFGQAGWNWPRGFSGTPLLSNYVHLVGHAASCQQSDAKDDKSSASGFASARGPLEAGHLLTGGTATNIAAAADLANGTWKHLSNVREDVHDVVGPCASGDFASAWWPISMRILHVQGAYSIAYTNVYRFSEGIPCAMIVNSLSCEATAYVDGVANAESSSEIDVSGIVITSVNEAAESAAPQPSQPSQ